MKKLLICLCLIFMLAFSFSGCSLDGKVTDDNYKELLPTAKIAAMTGSTGAFFVEENYSGASLSLYSNINDAFMALQGNKVDFVITALTTATNFARNNSELIILPDRLLDDTANIAVAKENPELLAKMSESITKFKENGTIDKVTQNWIRTDGSDYVVDYVPVADGDEVLKVGIAANREPMCFVMDSEIKGLDCELIERIAYDNGMRVEYVNMEFSELITALQVGKVDVVISNLTATDERREKVDFTEEYFLNPQVWVMKK